MLATGVSPADCPEPWRRARLVRARRPADSCPLRQWRSSASVSQGENFCLGPKVRGLRSHARRPGLACWLPRACRRARTRRARRPQVHAPAGSGEAAPEREQGGDFCLGPSLDLFILMLATGVSPAFCPRGLAPCPPCAGTAPPVPRPQPVMAMEGKRKKEKNISKPMA